MNRQILKLAVPFIISNITVPLVSTVDTALMGHFGTQAHLGAIGLGSSIFNFLYWNFTFLRMSMAGFTAQAYGANDKKESATLLGRSFLIAMAGAALLLVFQKPIAGLSFLIARGDPLVEQFASEYFYIRIYAAPATIGLYAILGWFIGMQNAKVPMIISLLINLVNIGVSVLLVLVFDMKSSGVAWGTVAAQYSGLLLAVLIVFKYHRGILDRIELSLLFKGNSVSRFFSVNRDVFVRTFLVIFVLTYYNFASAGQGIAILGVNVIFLQLIYAFSFFIDGFANAAEALIGRFIGERNKPDLQKSVRTLFLWGGGLGLAFTVAYSLVFDLMLKLFTSDTEIISLAADYSAWIMFLPVISFSAFVWDGIYLGATAAKEQRNATLIAAVIFFSIYFFLRNTLGNHALLLAQLTFFGIRGIVQTIYYKTAILERFFKAEIQ
ncbi:MAG: MATE family efflux transporter [Bacteroidales bacterium]|jgi:MATE family multidrug resistance protein